VGTPTKPDVRALLEKLTAGVERLGSEGRWEQFLAAQARFHRYSYANTLLILDQRPAATAVAGYRAWQGMGRRVRPGERAIWIVAPLLRCRQDPPVVRELAGFRRVAVFDLAQTEGEAVATLCQPLVGEDDEGWFGRFVDAATNFGFEVERALLPDGVFGDCTYALRRIRVSETASPAQAVKTLVHELAHGLLHEYADDRPLAELEAESVAYVVCQHLGLATDQYSFGYVTTWAGGSEPAIRAIKRSCQRIVDAARSLIELAFPETSILEASVVAIG
jgi:hypothetical protein